MSGHRITTDQIRANAAPVTPHPSVEEQIQRRGEWSKLFTTHEERPRSEDVTKFYPALAETARPICEEVKGYLNMREAKLMEELWAKEKDLERKVYEYSHHRSSERNSVNLQVGRGLERRPQLSTGWCAEEADRRGLNLQAPPTMGLLKELLALGHRPELEQAPKQQLVDELSELRNWGPDKILGFLSDNKLHTYTKNPALMGYLTEQRTADRFRSDRIAGPHPHHSSAPVLLDDVRSNTLLTGLRDSGASAQKQIQILRDLPISHSAKAQYIQELDVPPQLRVALLREMPQSTAREYELLRQLPLEPLRKLQFLQQLPVDPASKAAMMHELGLPPAESALLIGLKQLASECAGGMAEALDCFPGAAHEKEAVLEEINLQAFAHSMIDSQPAPLEATDHTRAKLDTLQEMKLMEQERRGLNRRLGYPVELEQPRHVVSSESLVNP